MLVPQEDEQLLNPEIAPPLGGVWTAAVHVKVVPAIVEFKAILLATPLQMVCAVAEPTGFGFTVTVMV
jgi:hypothetical protein